MTIPFKVYKERTFRRTEGVHFADISVPGSNGIDLVEHSGPAVSPPRLEGKKQFYVHAHQTDHNRVIQGTRLFELVFPGWTMQPHWWVYLTPETGALEIPPGCFHRSVSGKDGSLLLNHAVRDDHYDETKEFRPVVVDTADLVPASYYGVTPSEVGHFLQHGTIQ